MKIKKSSMTKYLTRIFTAAFCFLSLTSSAQKKQTPVIWYYNYFVGSDTLQFDKIYYDASNRPFKFNRFQFYTCGIELIDQDNDTVKLEDEYILATGADGGHDVGTHLLSKLTKIKFDLGVDSNHNHTDPSSYPSNHGLSPKDPTMHWGWESGYRFWAIEGWMDENKDGKFDNRFEYHMIGDAMIRTKSLITSGVEKDGKLFVVIDVQLKELFDSVDFAKNGVIHGGPWDLGAEPLIKIVDNAIDREVFTSGNGFNLKVLPIEQKPSFIVYPNPSQGRVNIISTATFNPNAIEVFSSNGQKVNAIITLENERRFIDLEKGVYWIKITVNNYKSYVIKTIVLE